MNTNGNVATDRNGTTGTNGRLPTQGVSIVKPQALRNGIALYGQVRSSDGRTWYTVKKKRTGKYRFTYDCSCPGNFLGEYHPCRHIAIFKLAESERSAPQHGGNGNAQEPVIVGNGAHRYAHRN